MNYLKIYLILSQLFVMFYWLSTNRTENVTKAFKHKSFITMVLYNSWGILFVVQIFFGSILSFQVYDVYKFLGLTIYTSGVALAIWAKWSLGKSWGLPEQHYLSSQKSMVTQGAYRFSRNPIYLSELLMLIGFELSLGSYLIFLIIPFYLFNRRKIIIEEKLLEDNFGEEYLKYKQKTRRFI